MAQSLAKRSEPVGASVAAVSDKKRPWTWQHYLAAIGVVFLAWEAWTLTAWLLDGPRQVTSGRDTGSSTWYIAVALQVLAAAAAFFLGRNVIRGVRRERRLTFDAMLCIACGSAYWLDSMANFFQPVLLYSTHWVNLNAWCGYAPFVINTSCDQTVEPILYIGICYAFLFYGCTILGGYLVRALRSRYPDISVAKLYLILGLGSFVVDIAYEAPMNYLHLWSMPAAPRYFSLFSGSHRYSLFMFFATFIFIPPIVLIRHFKDDRGRTVFERGLDHLEGRRRTATILLALIGVVQLTFAAAVVAYQIQGPYSQRWGNYPSHVLNGVCDNGAVTGTAYGPCPGSPGYKMPIKRTPSE